MSLSTHLFALAKSPLGDLIVGIAFGKFAHLLPVKKVKETDQVLAFWHPKPFWEKHILIVPKKPIRSITTLQQNDLVYIASVYDTAKQIVLDLGWDKSGYSISINGGNRQEVNQIHFHLFSGNQK